jgi:hypothetical protein
MQTNTNTYYIARQSEAICTLHTDAAWKASIHLWKYQTCSYAWRERRKLRLKDETVEPEEKAVARKWLCKHVSLATDLHTQQ